MTLNEFKAWLEGFEASLNGYAPDHDQWKAIKAKIDQITVMPAVPAPSRLPSIEPHKIAGWPPVEPIVRYVGSMALAPGESVAQARFKNTVGRNDLTVDHHPV